MPRLLQLLLVLILAASPAAAQSRRRPSRRERAPTAEELATAREIALDRASQQVAKWEQDLAKIRRRRGGNEEDVARLTAAKSYLEAFLAKHKALDDIAAYQQRCAREKLAGPETVARLEALNTAYRNAVKAMEEQAAEYKRLSGGRTVPDPIAEVLYPTDEDD